MGILISFLFFFWNQKPLQREKEVVAVMGLIFSVCGLCCYLLRLIAKEQSCIY